MNEGNLAKLLDALTEIGVYVIERDSHRLLYFNQRCRDMGRGRARLGAKCHEVWPEACGNCPLEAMNDSGSSHISRYDPLSGTTLDITAGAVLWDDKIPAMVITAAPRRLDDDAERSLKRIGKIYASSLVTVFKECVIANLTGDYYVNCQKDTLWTDIPQQGAFGAENRRYSGKTIHPDDSAAFDACFSREALLKLFGGGKKQMIKRLRRLMEDGTYHMVEFTATRLDEINENECWCVLVFRDIHEEYLQEQQMNLEISQLATAARIAYQMLIAVNLTQNTYHMIEYDRFTTKRAAEEGCFDELIEVGASTVDPDFREEFVRKFSRRSLLEAFERGEQKVSMEMRQLGDDGVYHWNHTQVVRVYSPLTDDVLEITLTNDIDEERRQQEERLVRERQAKRLLEEALQKAEGASQAKNDFLSKMSHDIRTPLNAIIGLTALSRLHLGDEGRLRDYLGKIENSSEHLLGLVNEVLDVSKIESGVIHLEETEFDLRELVRQSVEMVQTAAQKKEQSLEVNLPPDLSRLVIGDQQKLRQTLVNVLDNATKYTGRAGVITLTLREPKKEEPTVGTYQFIIEDNGTGMKEEYLQRIFEPFSRAEDTRTSKVSGTGLGMTIVKNILDMMGGDIRIESQYGQGSRFTITLCLPRAGGEGMISAETDGEAERGLPGMRALLVEDNELNRQIATEMLSILGTAVDTAEDGAQAVRAVRSRPPFYYDVIFMDIQMPVMNGYEAARTIRDSGMKGIEELPIIAMTADAFPEDIRKTRLAGMNGHLAKPFSLERLRQTLAHCARWKAKDQPGRSLDGK